MFFFLIGASVNLINCKKMITIYQQSFHFLMLLFFNYLHSVKQSY